MRVSIVPRRRGNAGTRMSDRENERTHNMKANWLITTAVAAILASTGLAVGQGMNERGGTSPGASEKNMPSKQPSGATRQRDKSGTTGQAREPERRPRTGAQQQKQQKQPRTGAQRKDGDPRTGAETTGRGDAAGVQFTSEQRTKIRQVVVSKKIPKVDRVNFTVSVGARVPTTVRFHPIPAEIVTIHPAWRGYRVILVGSELVIVHPRTYQIVAVIVV